VAVVGRISMGRVTKVKEDPLKEITESNWPAKAGYEWVAVNVRNQSSLFRWFRLLNSWLLYPYYRERRGLRYRFTGAGERY